MTLDARRSLCTHEHTRDRTRRRQRAALEHVGFSYRENASTVGSTGRTELAGLARPLGRTEALEAVLHVDAGAAVSTRTGGAFIGV